MFELHYVKTGLVSAEWGAFYAMLFKEDLRNDFDDFVVFTADDVLPLISQTEEFIQIIKSLIHEK